VSAPRKPELDAVQAASVERAREVLEAGTDPDEDLIERLARRVGALEYHVAELLALVGKLSGGEK